MLSLLNVGRVFLGPPALDPLAGLVMSLGAGFYEELTFRDGRLLPPARPGLGLELDRDAMADFTEAARRVAG